MQERILITVCGRAGSKGFKNKNLKTFCGKPLVYYTLAAIRLFCENAPQRGVDVVLNTDSDALRDLVLAAYPEVVYIPRPEALCGDTVPKMAVFQHSLTVMEQKTGPYSCHMDLDITSPLRRAEDVEGCYALLRDRPDLDVVMSAVPSRRSPYMNMACRDGDHVEQVVKTNFTARQQTPPCYDLNASLYAFRPEFLRSNKTGFLWDGRCEVYEMEDTAVLDIDSEEDFVMMELVGGHLYDTREDFARVRNSIPGV